MKKATFRLTSIFLAVLFLLQTLPLAVFAVELNSKRVQVIEDASNAIQNTAQMSTEDDVDPSARIISEVVSKRELNSKHFRMSDGTYTVQIYPQNIHFEKNGVLEEIDNTLQTTTKNGKAYYQNTANSMQVKLPANLSDSSPVEVTNGNHTIQWIFLNKEASSEASILQPDTNQKLQAAKNQSLSRAKSEEEKAKIENAFAAKAKLAKSSLSYAMPEEKLSLSYDLIGDKMKESIVLHQAPANKAPSFSFQINANTTIPELQDDGSVLFRAKDNTLVFTMQAPYMWDDNDVSSQDIQVSLENKGDHYLYTITPSADWLFDSKRQYPITIDPTIVTQQSASLIKDATGIYAPYDSEMESILLEDYNFLKVGDIWGYITGAYIYVPMPENIGDSGRIVKAELNVYLCTGGGVSTSSNPMTVCAYEILEDWDHTVITTNKVLFYSDIPESDVSPIDFKILNDASSSGDATGTPCTFDITRVAQKWATGESVNRGITLLPYRSTQVSDGQYLRFFDSDSTVAGSDPCFIYTYRDTKGVEDYWTYTTMPAGKSGTAAINNFNGNLFVSQNLTGIDGNRLPVSISALYDSSSRSKNDYFLGNGWKTNYNMSVHTSNLDSHPYYFVDSDGTQHYFYPQEENSTSWKDEDGLGYTLTRDSSVYTDGFLITDKAKTKSYFRSDGRLGRLQDTFGNQININYTAENKISSITDGSGRSYSFAYNSDGNISSITNPAQKTVSFAYANGNLTSITYPDAKSVGFVYGDYGLNRVTNIDNTYVAFEYTYANYHLYTTSMAYFGSNNVCTEDYNLLYQHNRTQITSDTDNTIDAYFQFDNDGRTTAVINNCAKTTEYYKYGAAGGTDGTSNKLLSASKTVGYSATGKLAPELIDPSKWTISQDSTAQISLDTSKGHVSAPSLKVQQTVENGGYAGIECDAGIVKSGETRRMSAYINADGLSYTNHSGIFVSSYYIDSEGVLHTGAGSGQVIETMGGAWISISSTITPDEDARVYFRIGCQLYTPGSFWVDDIAFDTTGDHLNYVENSNFNNSAEGWEYLVNDVSTEKISDDIREGIGYEIFGNETQKISLKRTLRLSGKAGDVLSFGASSFGFSVPTGMVKSGAAGETTWRVRLELTNESGTVAFPNQENILNYNYGLGYNVDSLGDLQTLQTNLIAPCDFTGATFYFDYEYNTGGTLLHEPFVYLENTAESYAYDANGNVVSTVDLSSTEATFAYQDNNLSQMINPTGSRYSYTYNAETNALEYAASSDGQLYAFVYDEYGNVISSTQRAFQNAGTITNGEVYYIRNAATGNLLRASGTQAASKVQNGSLANQDNSIRWKAISADESDTYYLVPLSSPEYQLENSGTSLVINPAATTANQKFKILLNDDGTFRILLASDNEKALDGRDAANNNDTTLGAPITVSTHSNTHSHQKWYFTPYAEVENEETISAFSTYTSDGTYVSSVTNTLGDTTSYAYNSDGTVSSTTDFNGNQTQYTYDHNNGQVLAVVADESDVRYTYEKARLKSIETPNDTIYTFVYDEQGRTTSILVNRKDSTAEPRTLVSYLYSSDTYQEGFTNGSLNNVSKVTYGNGYEIYKTYDSKLGLIAVDGDNLYRYSSNGRIFSKESFRDITTETFYYYDLAGRPTSQVMLNAWDYSPYFSIAFRYQDHTNLLDGYSASSPEFRLKTSFVYGDPEKGEIPEAIYGVKTNDQLTLSYTYDSFARRSSRTLHAGNGITTTYTYKSSDELNHFGVIPEGGTYTPSEGEALEEGEAFPATVAVGDVYSFDDYSYTFDAETGGWKVSLNTSVTDQSKTSYGKILESINHKKITNLYRTFFNCASLTSAPAIPGGVTHMNGTYGNCTSLATPPEIPFGVVDMYGTFGYCSALATAPIIPGSVTNMYGTFLGCTSLTAAPAIPGSVINMTGTFQNCSALVTPPDMSQANSVTTLYGAFYGCASMVTAPTIPGSVTSVYAIFNGCTSLTTAPAIPSGVTEVMAAFYNCSSLVTPPSLTGLTNVTNFSHLFRGCSSLTSAPAFPANATDLSYAFLNCTSLTTAPTIPSNVTTLEYAFYGCTALTSAPIIPSAVTNLSYAFYGCTALVTAPAIPVGVATVDYIFYGCSALTAAPAIPSGVTNIRAAFGKCSSLVSSPDLDHISGASDCSYLFYLCPSLVSAPELPTATTNLYGAFYGCTALTSAPTIPAGVTDVYAIFYNCTNLTGTVTVNANPTTYTHCFGNTTKPIVLEGSCTDTTKAALAATSSAGNVTYTPSEQAMRAQTSTQSSFRDSVSFVTPDASSVQELLIQQPTALGEVDIWTERSSSDTQNRVTALSKAAAQTRSTNTSESTASTTSTLVETVSEGGFTSHYTYDGNGNITSYTRTNDTTGEKVESWIYEYDAKNQLVFAGTDASRGTRYTYDTNGNLLTKTDVATGTVKSYAYTDPTWADLLTSYDGSPITYDEIGNPLSYRNGMSFTWSYGKSLASATVGGKTYHFGYDADGYRIEKRSEDLRNIVQYTVMDGVLYGEQHITTTDDGSVRTTINYLLDENGTKYGFVLNGTEKYYYRFNLQGDVTGIYNASGTLVAQYTYDAWGKPNAPTGDTEIGNLNPIRYRGYYYDSETGLYYVSSRYYDPETCRFVNCDAIDVLNASPLNFVDKNLYAYCDNNPVVRIDVGGQIWESVFDVISLGASLIEVCAEPTDIWAWVGLVGDALDLIPFLTGVGEGIKAIRTVKAVKVINKVADGLGDLSQARKYGIQSYKSLRNLLKGTGLHAHHIVEKRLVAYLDIDVHNMLSVAVTPAEHQKFTNAWRRRIPHGTKYRELSREYIWEVAQEVYKDYPEILKAAEKILFE